MGLDPQTAITKKGTIPIIQTGQTEARSGDTVQMKGRTMRDLTLKVRK